MAEMTFCGNTDCEFNNIAYFRGCSSPQVLNVLLCPGYRAVEEEKEAVAEQDKSEPEKSDRENLKEYLFRTKEIKDDLIYNTKAGTGWGCDFCVYTGTEAEICKECEDGSHFERQEPKESELFIDPATLHSWTCRCDACKLRRILHNELKNTEKDRIIKQLQEGPGEPTVAAEEKDPEGIQQHEPGAKLDDGKLLAGLLLQWSRALTEVLKVSTFGANKYSRGGWQHVKNGPERYTDAMFRHLLKEPVEDLDPDSGLLHAAHAAWNALSRLELLLREKETQK